MATWKKILVEGDAVVNNLATADLTQSSSTNRVYNLNGDGQTLSFKGGKTQFIDSANDQEFSFDSVNRVFDVHNGNPIRFREDNDGNYIALKSPTSVGSDYTIILPSSAPGGNNKILESDSGGNLSWIATPSGGGSGTTINNNADNKIITGSGTADTLEAEANLTYDGANLTVASGSIFIDNNQGYYAQNTSGSNRILARADNSDVAVFNAGFTQTLIGGANGITLNGPVTANEIVHVGSGISSAGNVGEGAETTVFGGSGSTSSFAGRAYYYGGSGWLTATQSSAVANANLLGIAMGGNTGVGMCLKGFVKTDVTNLTPGKAAYMNTNATITTTAPSTSGNFSRIIGYAVASDTIFFNPSNEYIELS